jgi:hypothetical protein
MLQSVFADIPPSMSETEVAFYSTLLSRARSVVEYGAGGSTLLSLKSEAERIISIEADPQWVCRLQRNWRIRWAVMRGRLSLRYINIGPVKKRWSRPKDETKKHLWPNYALAPWQDNTLVDLVLVDGRFRVACIAQAALNAPGATITVHDFWNRPHYHDTLSILDEVSRAGTMGVFTVKPDVVRPATQLYESYCFDPR